MLMSEEVECEVSIKEIVRGEAFSLSG